MISSSRHVTFEVKGRETCHTPHSWAYMDLKLVSPDQPLVQSGDRDEDSKVK